MEILLNLFKKIPFFHKLPGDRNFLNQDADHLTQTDMSGLITFSVLSELEKMDILPHIDPLYTDDTLIYVDFPRRIPSENPFPIQGWIASRYEIKKVWIPFGTDIELDLIERPDVIKLYSPFPNVKGFAGTAPKQIIKGHTIKFRYRLDKGDFTHTAVLGMSILPELKKQEKIRKLARISSHLICPRCAATLDNTKIHLDNVARQFLGCPICSASYSYTADNFNFLPEEIKEQFDIVETSNVSSHELDPLALSIVGRFSEGLILDCGAGSHDFEYPNVINLEVVAYPSTDIQAVNERLPFQDETFDAVFSFAVLEHVKDPFRGAQEISRVLKKGGILYCVVPFLQPLHGYPNHFFNMTSQGLRNLFDKAIIFLDYRVPVSGLPIWTLSWFLKSWADGLSKKTRQDFLSMKVADLISNPWDYLKQDFVTELSKEKQFELASTTMFIGKKSQNG